MVQSLKLLLTFIGLSKQTNKALRIHIQQHGFEMKFLIINILPLAEPAMKPAVTQLSAM